MDFLFPTTIAITPTSRCYPSYSRACAPRTSRPQIHPILGLVEAAAVAASRPTRRVPRFDVVETKDAYEVQGELPGWEQENIGVEFTDERTLAIKGRYGKNAEQKPTAAAERDQKPDEGNAKDEPEKPDNASVKSNQPTVEDDFEDLGDEAMEATLTSTTVSEDKGKAPVTDDTIAEKKEAGQAVPHPRRSVSERSYGSFTRSFRFPERIDQDGVKASLRNGVLYVHVPKAPVPEVRRVNIE